MAIQPPTIALQPGSTNTAAVKQLQDWLVSKGYMTEAEKNTGYGTYGPQTTSAVQKLQIDMNVDNSTGPGYWGNRTITAVNTSKENGALPDKKVTTQTSSTSSASPTVTSTPQVSTQKALLGAIADVATSAAATGKPPISFAEALDLASKDPVIVAKYADMAKLDAQSFQQQIQQAQTAYGLQSEQQKMQFEAERKALAEKQAASGTAYSGFRGKAQENLAKTESGIVTSARSQQQQQLNQLTSAFEQKYGTGSTPQASVTAANPFTSDTSMSGLKTTGTPDEVISGQTAGGVTGTVGASKTADVNASALSSYNTAQFPQV